jgi:nucleoid-associated protein YgaU
MSTPPNKPDFSNVQGSVTSTEQVQEKADFSNVQSSVTSTEEIVGDSEQTYTVVKGDTLSHIAKHFYGKASQWHAIFDANRDQLDNPDKIRPGQVLKIPAAKA